MRDRKEETEAGKTSFHLISSEIAKVKGEVVERKNLIIKETGASSQKL